MRRRQDAEGCAKRFASMVLQCLDLTAPGQDELLLEVVLNGIFDTKMSIMRCGTVLMRRP